MIELAGKVEVPSNGPRMTDHDQEYWELMVDPFLEPLPFLVLVKTLRLDILGMHLPARSDDWSDHPARLCQLEKISANSITATNQVVVRAIAVVLLILS